MGTRRIMENDKELVRQFHRELRPAYRWNDPWLVGGLRELVEVHQYSDTDIALMLGLSNVRVNQLRHKLRITKSRTGSGSRYFDWELGRFQTVSAKACRRVHIAVRCVVREDAKRERRDALIVWMREFAAVHRSSPSLRDIRVHLGLGWQPSIYQWLGYVPGKNRAADLTARLYAEAGLPRRRSRNAKQ